MDDLNLQPVSWEWIKAVLISSVLIVTVTSGMMLPLGKLIEQQKLNWLPNWSRWVLVLPTAFSLGYLAEVVPRILFTLLEVTVNHELLFRPGFDSLIWQLWAPVSFVAGGVQMAPAHKFASFAIVGGLKIVAAVTNLVQVFRFVHGGGPWTATDPITNSPLWWNSGIYVTCIAVVSLFGVMLAKQAVNERARRVCQVF